MSYQFTRFNENHKEQFGKFNNMTLTSDQNLPQCEVGKVRAEVTVKIGDTTKTFYSNCMPNFVGKYYLN